MKKNEIFITYGQNPYDMTMELLKEIHPENEINKNDRVVLKPNLVVAKKSSSGATTHIEMIEATVDYLREFGIRDILLAEGSWIGDDTKRAFKISGFAELAKRLSIPMLDLKDDDYETVVSDNIRMQVSKTVLRCNYLISYPVLKGHCQTAMTCALKNMKGCLSDSSKRYFHTLGLHRPIAALNAVRCADLVLADSICGDLDYEEGGNPVTTNRMLAARDSVLLDTYGTRLLGYEIDDVPYIRMAEKLGVGSTDLDKAEIRELRAVEKTEFPVSTRKIKRLERYAKSDKACSACYGNLVHALSRLDEQGLLERLGTDIYIGQGFRGKAYEGIGIGACCRGCSDNVSGCPPTAHDIVEKIREYV